MHKQDFNECSGTHLIFHPTPDVNVRAVPCGRELARKGPSGKLHTLCLRHQFELHGPGKSSRSGAQTPKSAPRQSSDRKAPI